MLSSGLTEEQKLVKNLVSEFARKEIEPLASRLDRDCAFPGEIVSKLFDLGFMGHFVPERYGGSGLDYLSYVMAVEEISRACASTGAIVMVHNSLACGPILEFGTEEQKKKYLPALCGGGLGCFSLSEPESGSDAASITAGAVKKDGRYVVNGIKSWVTNGSEAKVAVLFARTDKSKKSRGITAFIVDLDAHGISLGKSESKLGIKVTSTSQLMFEDCELSSDSLLGREGCMFVWMKFFSRGRKQMIRFINIEDENRNYPMLDMSNMLYEDDEFDDESAELFENVSYLCYDDDSIEISREEREKRVLH